MSNQKQDRKDGPSNSGYHFVQAYQNCKRKFYWQYVKGLEPIHMAPAILFGTAGHAGLEEWYKLHSQGSSISKKVKLSIEAAVSDLESRREHYYEMSKFEAHKQQLKDTFHQYGLQYEDQSFKVVSIEDSLEVELQYGDMFTGRLDLVVMQNDGRLMIMDHKFTSWSLSNFKRAVQANDQSTAYTLLWNKNNPQRRAAGVIFNLIRNYQGSIDFLQVPVYRSQVDVDIFEKEVSENLRDLSQRVIDPEASWPKNTDQCFSYNRACPFLELCQGAKFDGLIGVKYTTKEDRS